MAPSGAPAVHNHHGFPHAGVRGGKGKRAESEQGSKEHPALARGLGNSICSSPGRQRFSLESRKGAQEEERVANARGIQKARQKTPPRFSCILLPTELLVTVWGDTGGSGDGDSWGSCLHGAGTGWAPGQLPSLSIPSLPPKIIFLGLWRVQSNRPLPPTRGGGTQSSSQTLRALKVG